MCYAGSFTGACEYDATMVLLLHFDDGTIGKVASIVEGNAPYSFLVRLHYKGTLVQNRFYAELLEGQTGWTEVPTIIRTRRRLRTTLSKDRWTISWTALCATGPRCRTSGRGEDARHHLCCRAIEPGADARRRDTAASIRVAAWSKQHRLLPGTQTNLDQECIKIRCQTALGEDPRVLLAASRPMFTAPAMGACLFTAPRDAAGEHISAGSPPLLIAGGQRLSLAASRIRDRGADRAWLGEIEPVDLPHPPGTTR